MSAPEFQIVIDEKHADTKDKLKTLVSRLESAGLSDVQCLESICIITGKADANKASKLASVPGVLAVEGAGVMQLPEKELLKPELAKPEKAKADTVKARVSRSKKSSKKK